MLKLKWLYLINFCLFGSALLISTLADASVSNPSAAGFQSSKEQCASALNSYLLYRHSDSESDNYKLQKLESQVESMCDGYQVRMVESNGVKTGIIEAID